MFRIRENSDILFGYLQYKFCSKISFFANGSILLMPRDLEEELTVVGKNLQQLEVGEEQTRVREEKLQIQILELR